MWRAVGARWWLRGGGADVAQPPPAALTAVCELPHTARVGERHGHRCWQHHKKSTHSNPNKAKGFVSGVD